MTACISTQKDRNEKFMKGFGVLPSLREHLEQNHPEFEYRYGLQRHALRVYVNKKVWWWNEPKEIIKTVPNGCITVFDDEYVWLAEKIAEKYNELTEALI